MVGYVETKCSAWSVVASVLLIATLSQAFHETLFAGLQEIDDVHITHTIDHRTRRWVRVGNKKIPDFISTEIRGDNHTTRLKFQRKRHNEISRVFTFDKELKRLVIEKTAGYCMHIYEDNPNSAHALVDGCNHKGGIKMIAEIVHNNATHVILPKGDNSDMSSEHGLYKITSSIDFAHDYKRIQPALDENNLPQFNHRLRRQTERNIIEVMFVVDYSLYQFWYGLTTGTASQRETATLDLIQRMYAFMGNGVNMRFAYLQTMYGVDVGVQLTSIYVLKTAAESSFTENENVNTASSTRGVVDAATLLDSFKTWIDNQKVSNPTTFANNDHYMLFTARDISLSGNQAAAGYAYYSTICTSQSVSIVEDTFNFLSVAVAAHELGHSLGGVHDGEAGGAVCRDNDGYILSAINAVFTDARTNNPWKFSLCSANSFATTLRDLEASSNNCLKRDDKPFVLPATGRRPGQMFPPDQQCKLMLDEDSVMWRQTHVGALDKMCTAMACTQNLYTELRFVIPGDGTTCGDKKWCWNGACVYSEEAPSADETCVHGDQAGAIISGETCGEALSENSSKWKCYQKNIVDNCCATCKAYHTNIAGCAYGDKSNCSTVSASQCYNPNIASSCCETCYNFAQRYLNIRTGCKYGDRVGNCERTASVCQQYPSECCSTCNGLTTPSTSSTTTKNKVQTSKSTEIPKSTGSTRTTQKTDTPEKKKDSLPDWLVPVAGGVGGVVVLSMLIGLCYYCWKQNSKGKYVDKDRRRSSNGKYKRSSEDRRRSSEKRRSEDNRRRSKDNKRGRQSSEPSVLYKSDDRNMRRASESALRAPKYHNRRRSEHLGRNDFRPYPGFNDRSRY